MTYKVVLFLVLNKYVLCRVVKSDILINVNKGSKEAYT